MISDRMLFSVMMTIKRYLNMECLVIIQTQNIKKQINSEFRSEKMDWE